MTTAAQHQQEQRSSYLNLVSSTYDPDEVVPHDSPLMKALHPKLELSPSPPPEIPLAQVSLSPSSFDGRFKSNRQKIRNSSGDAVLVAYLDNGRRPEIAQAAGNQALPGPNTWFDDDDDEGVEAGDSETETEGEGAVATRVPAFTAESPTGHTVSRRVPPIRSMTNPPSLQHLAADALHVVSVRSPRSPPPKLTPDISASTRQLSISDDRPLNVSFSQRVMSRPSMQLKTESSPTSSMLTPGSGELPPLQMDSPKSESNGQSLPSIRSTLGDINRLPAEPPTPSDSEMPMHGTVSVFSRSPPVGMPRLSSISGGHVSPPVSPNEAFQRGLPSPHSLPASSPYYYSSSNGRHQRPSIDYSNCGSGETPSTDQSGSTPATSVSVADRMSIDGITNPQVGVYACTFSGCTAAPFQTQYLLNSHANVHSSARPHYCPVQGCPRSEGGKGFKRKNEMIRHGLVHDSPGYVCPFCPDREHKYPRPDNLQRHVRVHHVDKDKDDPLLREVLAQRPDGPNRGRRRRGGPG